MTSLDGKVAVVTGATSGIGRGCALSLAQAGARLVVTGRNEERGALTVQMIEAEGGVAKFVRQDVTQEDQWVAVMQDTIEAFGRLDILLNNAGDARVGSLEKLSLDDLLFLLRVDVEGPFLGMKHAWSHLAEAGGGVILNMSSIAGQRPISGGIAYCAAKGALTSLTRGAAAEGKPVNIRVNSIHPGMIWTEGVTDILGDNVEEYKPRLLANIPMGRFGDPADVAAAVVYLASDAARHITGAQFNVDGGQLVR